jgi:hypothetical protein
MHTEVLLGSSSKETTFKRGRNENNIDM